MQLKHLFSNLLQILGVQKPEPIQSLKKQLQFSIDVIYPT